MKDYKANNGKKKIYAIAICLLLTVVFAVGGTVAYLLTSTPSVKNTFTPASAPNEIEENFNGEVKSGVKILVPQGDKNVDVYVRVAMVATWQDTAGNVAPATPVAGTDYIVDMGSDKWVKNGDFYYYTEVVAPGTETEVLFDSITVVEGKAPAGYTLHVELMSQSIQADGMKGDMKVVESAWGVDPDEL